MKSLLRKEARALLPLYGLVALIFSGDILTRPFTQRLDEASWLDIAADLSPAGSSGAGIVYLVCAMMIAYAAFPREHDEGTIELLHALPVSRWSVLVAKVVVGVAALWLAAIGGELTNWLQQSPNPQSFEGEQWSLAIAAPAVLLRCAVLLIFYCHGLFASFFRRFGLLPVLLVAIALASLIPLAPELAVLDPTEIVAFRYEGSRIVWPTTGLLLHGALAAGSFAIAAMLWLGAGERSGVSFDPGKATLGGRVALGCGTAVGVIAALVITAAGVQCRSEPFAPGPARPRAPAPPEGSSFDVQRRSTACCDLTYPTALAHLALPAERNVDAIYEEIARVLGSHPTGRVSIDMTSDADSHLGVASWTSVRVSLRDHDDEHDLLRTVAHEITHTFQHRMLGDEADDVRDSIGFFLEGSAEWVASRVVSDDAADHASRRLGALVWTRHRVSFDELADRKRFRARLSHLLEYPLGEAFARALAQSHGDGAAGTVLRTISTATGEDYEGRAYWEAILASSGMSLSAVVAALEDEVARTARVEAAFVSSVPEIGGGVALVQDGRAVVLALLDRDVPPDARHYLAVRRHSGVDDDEVRGFEGTARAGSPRVIEYDVPAAFVDRVQMQLGIAMPGTTRPYFTEWRGLVLP